MLLYLKACDLLAEFVFVDFFSFFGIIGLCVTQMYSYLWYLSTSLQIKLPFAVCQYWINCRMT